METKISYIYTLASSENPELIRYVGYSFDPNKRLVEHLKEAKYIKKYRRHNWVNSVLENGHTIVMNCAACAPEYRIGEKETEIVLFYKTCGADLVNGNNGGIGGRSPSKEVREKCRISKLGNTWNIGRKYSKERNDKISKSKKGIKKSKEAVEKMAASKRGVPHKNRTLSENQVIEMFKLYNEGAPKDYIAKTTKVTESNVVNVLWGKKFYADIKSKNNLVLIPRPKGGNIVQKRKELDDKYYASSGTNS